MLATTQQGAVHSWNLCCCLAAVVLLGGCGATVPDNAYQSPPPPDVGVAVPIMATVTRFIEENGETEVVERAEVRARVRGFLNAINFKPGQFVRAGDVLYEIQREEYEAAVNSAQAALSSAEAAVVVAEAQVGVARVEVSRAQKEFVRYKDLLAKDATTQKQFDQAEADLEAAQANASAAEATVTAAEAERGRADANLAQAKLDLGYTQVVAPIDGHVTKTEIKVGNLIENGDLLATVVDHQRIYANFNVSDRDILRLRQAAPPKPDREDGADARYRGWPTQLRRELDDGFRFLGGLDYVDQEGVDQATGTFAMRAVFENPDDLILPGLFVRVRVPVGKIEDALLIPEQSLLRDQQGMYVLVVDEANTVQKQDVKSGQRVGSMIVIEEGLAADDTFLLSGFQRARPGAAVNPTTEELVAPAELDNQPTLPEDRAAPQTNPSTADESAGDTNE